MEAWSVDEDAPCEKHVLHLKSKDGTDWIPIRWHFKVEKIEFVTSREPRLLIVDEDAPTPRVFVRGIQSGEPLHLPIFHPAFVRYVLVGPSEAVATVVDYGLRRVPGLRRYEWNPLDHGFKVVQ